MSDRADIEAALRAALPADLHGAIPALAQTLAEASTGILSPEEAQSRLTANPELAQTIRALAGQEVKAGRSVISFDGAQVGDVTISGDVAGRDVVKVNLAPTTINTGGGDYAEGDIDKRRGAFVEGSNVFGDVIGEKHEHYYAPTTPIRSPQEQRNRKAMLQKVKNIWITGFLERSLTEELRIDLNLTDRPDAVDIPLNAVVQELNQPPRKLPPGVPVSAVFDDAGGELLILGAPGAGKTTLLLELLRDLLKRAETDEAHPMPVVFPLSTWATERKPLKDWLVDQLNVIYDVPKKMGQGWVDENEVLPLLDGLDEVAAEHRDACAEAINTYRREVGGLAPTAVASRILDYETLKGRLRLKGAVLVEPLTKEQVERYLTRVGEPLRAVRELVENDAEVMDLLDSPLMLSIVTLAFQDASPELLQVAGTVEERRGRLWEAYVERMFSRKGKETKYSHQQMKKWLSWLGRQLVADEQIMLFIERIQPRSLTKEYLEEYSNINLVLDFVIYGIFACSFFSLAFNPVAGLFLGLIIALLMSYATNQENDELKLLSAFSELWWDFDMEKIYQLITPPDTAEPTQYRPRAQENTSTAFIRFVSGGLLYGIYIAGGIWLSAIRGQKQVNSLKGLVWLWSLPKLTRRMWFFSLFSLVLFCMFFLGLSFGLILGCIDVLRHYSLRYLLYRQGFIPFLDLIPWLDHCVDRLFLRRVGGGYIFIHRMLMEHFAAMTDEDITQIAGEVDKKHGKG